MTADLPEGRVALSTVTDLPWDGRVELVVDDAPKAEWTLSLRIPSCAAGAKVSVNGTPAATCGCGAPGRPRTRSCSCCLHPRFSAPDPRIDSGRGSVVLERGPLVYCFQQVDQPEGTGLDLVELLPDAPLQDRWRPELLGGVVTITVRGRPVAPFAPTGALPYGSLPAQPAEPHPEEIELTVVPYFRWANRELGLMRAFVPITAHHPAHSEGN